MPLATSHSVCLFSVPGRNFFFVSKKPNHVMFGGVFDFVKRTFWTHETLFLCLCRYKLALHHIWLISNFLMYHDLDSLLWYLEFFGNEPHWSADVLIDNVLNIPYKFWCSYNIKALRVQFFCFCYRGKIAISSLYWLNTNKVTDF